jgi:ubiquinone/menaquinone biosynthesis C-methylase UbiE
MSLFVDKIRRGQVPSEQDWEAHLISAHAEQPRMTPEAFAGFKTDAGADSYQTLAGELNGQETQIVDLACGDGHLIPYILDRVGSLARVTAVDMSPEGIVAARESLTDRRVEFVVARAQELPLPDNVVDHVLCHMAFMLMTPVEPVVAELRRVLKPGGRFSAVIGGGAAEGLYRQIQRLLGLFVQAHLPRYGEARVGSSAVGDAEGLDGLFKDGFQLPVTMRQFHLRYHVTPEGVWTYARNMYFVPAMPEPVQRELRDELMAVARDHLDSEGKVLFHVPMKLFTLLKS